MDDWRSIPGGGASIALPAERLSSPQERVPSKTQFAPDVDVAAASSCPLHSESACSLLRVEATRSAVPGEDRFQAMTVRWGMPDGSDPGLPIWKKSVPLQVVAPSDHADNQPRRVALTALTIGTCSDDVHPISTIGAFQHQVGASRELACFRPTRVELSKSVLGVMEVIRTMIGDPARYEITFDSCGSSSGLAPMNRREITACVEVFPADEFELTIEAPWTAKKLWKKKTINPRFESANNNKKIRKDFYSDAQELPVSVELAITDGQRPAVTIEGKDIVSCITSARTLAGRLKDVSSWIKKAQVGLVTTLEGELDLIGGELAISWGLREQEGAREVFLWGKAAASLLLITGELKGTVGLQMFLFAELKLYIKIEGDLGIEGEIERPSPGQVHGSIKPTGSFEVQGGLEAGAGCEIISGDISIRCGVELDADDFTVLGHKSGAIPAAATSIPAADLVNPAAARGCGVAVRLPPPASGTASGSDADSTDVTVFGGKIKIDRQPLLLTATVQIIGFFSRTYTRDPLVEEKKGWLVWDIDKNDFDWG